MDPKELIAPASPLGLPAPLWFIELFKVLGFTLHMVPMNLWYAGLLLAMLLRRRGGEHARRLSARLMKPMPIVVALGINFGIVPLLFVQVAYHQVFYPATILMAWPWLSIIGLLVVAYYGVYLYVSGLRDNGAMPRYKQMAGWASAVLFIAIGFIFANGFSLMTNLSAWPALWKDTSVAGAPLGIGLNTGADSLWPRWLMMLGLAFTTVGAYVAVDAALFARKESADYHRWARSFALRVYTLGMVWFAATGSWYAFGTWSDGVRDTMFQGPAIVLTAVTAVAPGLPWLLLAASRVRSSQAMALAAGGAQAAVLALNAVSRQIVQNVELNEFLDISARSVNAQWSPMAVFLVMFVVGAAVIAWMVGKAAAAHARPAER